MRKLEVLHGDTLAGTLAEVSPGEIHFEYSEGFLEAGFSLSPYFLPLKAGLQRESTLVFGGLFGAFDDSLPDGWGLILMDRDFRQHGKDPARLSPLDRLAYVGSHGMGALSYRPASGGPKGELDAFDLIQLAAQAERIAKGSPEKALPALVKLGGSPGGARPKVVVGYHPAKKEMIADCEVLPPGYQRWMVKFRWRGDDPEAGRMEAAYHDMAHAAGIGLPETLLFHTSLGDFVGFRRFDRDPGDRRIHTHTFGGLIHASFREPNRDYRELLEVTLDLTKDHAELEEAFRRMVFNILAHNRDDHVKNFAFQHLPGKGWRLSPAYDLTFSDGVRGQHNLTALGQGEPGPSVFPKMADAVGLPRARAREIVEQVEAAVAQWETFAKERRVTTGQRKKIAQALQGIRKD